MSFQIFKPHIITYRNYKSYDNDVFRSEIQSFCSLNKADLGQFKETIFGIFKKQAPITKNTFGQPKPLSWLRMKKFEVILEKCRYRNKILKDKSHTSRENYKIQQNLCKKLLRKTKILYFESLNRKNKNKKQKPDNRPFWKTVVPLYTKKASKGEKIILNKAEKHIPIFLMIKKYVQLLITCFQTLS